MLLALYYYLKRPLFELMHRWTARTLLILLLVSTFAPAAMAVDGPPQHACCLRTSHSHQTTLTAVHQSDGSCCPPIATNHWAQVNPQDSFHNAAVIEVTPRKISQLHRHSLNRSSYSGRAPPAFSIA